MHDENNISIYYTAGLIVILAAALWQIIAQGTRISFDINFPG